LPALEVVALEDGRAPFVALEPAQKLRSGTPPPEQFLRSAQTHYSISWRFCLGI